MDTKLYKAAIEGDTRALKEFKASLDHLETQIHNTILHLHLANAKERSLDFVRQVLRRCPSLLPKQNDNGDTPLHLAARYGHALIVGELISQAKAPCKQDVAIMNKKNKKGDTALHEAARNGRLKVMELLIEKDPGLEQTPNAYGETPLYLAVEGKHVQIVLKMLGDCTVLACDGPNGKTAVHAAVIASFPCGEDDASFPGPRPNILREILKKREIIVCNKADDCGWTPLHYAAYLDHSSAAKLLLEADPSIAYATDKKRKMTALHLAASRDATKTMKQIIDHYPDCCDLVDAKGWSVLHCAGASQSLGAALLILKNPSLQILVNQADKNGMTPAHLLNALRIRRKLNFSDVRLIGLFNITKLLVSSSKAEESASKWMEDLYSSSPIGRIAKVVAGEWEKQEKEIEELPH